jgi:hypothetical protein
VVSLRLQAVEMRLRRSPMSVSLVFFADFVGKKHQRDNDLWGRSPSTAFTCGKLRLRTAKYARKSVPAHSGGG